MLEPTYYKDLVTQAQVKRDIELKSNTILKELSFEDSRGPQASPIDIAQDLKALMQDLKAVNDHITVDNSDIESATNDYNKLAFALSEELPWPLETISVIPQGSASTKTLIRSPDNSKFDIDAVCSVSLPQDELDDPMAFYKKVGGALNKWNPDAKKRCWKVDFDNRHYYIEFTPSTPLSRILQLNSENTFLRPNRYKDSALAVVDTPTQKWKASNPEGFSSWVSDQASKPLLTILREESNRASYDGENIAPVPEQEVELSDTLRVAIRLLKRHRDMSVRRNLIERDSKPISIIIVTLLTQCYEGLVNNGASYTHPIELLIDLVELMPYMIEDRSGQLWVANPTVEGENFAEKWNTDTSLKTSFDTWCKLLRDDLQQILSAVNETARSKKIREAFGCTAASTPTPPGSSGLAPKKPTKTHKSPAKSGLA